MPAVSPDRPAIAPAPPVLRKLGSLHLRQLVGKSRRTMVWRVFDPRVDQELLIVMPRARPAGSEALRRWREAARRASRVEHPSLAHVVEIAEHDGWPCIVHDPGGAVTLDERFGATGQSAAEAATWAAQVLEGLAFAHDAGLEHGDLQPHMVLLPDLGPARLLGLGAADDAAAWDSGDRRSLRDAAERDVLALGILLHRALAGSVTGDGSGVDQAIDRLPPWGRDLIRLPWTTARPIPEALRAIVNRSTDRQPKHRYHHARTMLRALEGWLHSEGESGAGPLAQLLERIGATGLLPAMPGAAQRAARLALMERGRNDELAEVVMQDTALSCELLRLVNSAQVRTVAAAGNGPILTVRRAIDMLGLDGVRRAAFALRDWPGPLGEEHSAALEQAMDRARRAGRIARWLRPAGYDGEFVFLLAVLQNLGRLVVRYHFPDEAEQIARLMRPAVPPEPGGPEEPGMTETSASFAVLGVDLASVTQAIGRQWGLEPAVVHMLDRVAADARVRAPATDDELLRLTACCANEVVDAVVVAPNRLGPALQRIAQRYAKALGVTLRDLAAVAADLPPPAFQVAAAATSEGGGGR